MENITAGSMPNDGSPVPPRGPLPPHHISTHRQLQLGVGIAEYMHYASITRANETAKNREYESKRGPTTLLSLLKNRFHKGHREDLTNVSGETNSDQSDVSEKNASGVKKDHVIVQNAPVALESDVWDASARDAELYLASRVMRTAGWGSAFYCMYQVSTIENLPHSL